MIEQESVLAGTPAADGAAAPIIFEVTPERRVWSRLRRRNMLVSFAAYIVFFAASIAATVWASRQWPALMGNPLAPVIVAIIVGSVARALFLKAVWWLPRRRALNLAAATVILGDRAQIAERLTASFSTRRWIHPETFHVASFVTASRMLNRRVLLMIRRPEHPGLPAPSSERFEPVPLDDSDERFDDIAEHLIGTERRSRRHRWPGFLRRIGRNIIIGDVPFYAFILLLFLLLDVYFLIRFGRLTFGMLMTAFFFYLVVLRPRDTAFSGAAQWWAIPAGLLIRGAEPKRFNADSASLGIMQSHFGRWFAVAYQGEDSADRYLTHDEVLLLLSAWTSGDPAPEFIDAG